MVVVVVVVADAVIVGHFVTIVLILACIQFGVVLFSR
jgi:hypothetical protein